MSVNPPTSVSEGMLTMGVIEATFPYQDLRILHFSDAPPDEREESHQSLS
jgi:hypothetical protein